MIQNSGSSSLKFSIFGLAGDGLRALVSGNLSGIGTQSGHFSIKGNNDFENVDEPVNLPDHHFAVARLMEWLRSNSHTTIDAVGHRVVHGGREFVTPQQIDDRLVEELRQLSRFAPLHLPPAIATMESSRKEFSDVPHVACFDTSFHRTMPERARMLPLTKELFFEDGVEKFGFHGISYESIMDQLSAKTDLQINERKVIIAHLGNGCSMAAVQNGQSIDTTMGFSPTGGLVMGTRSGDIDPGLIAYFVREKNMSAIQFVEFVNRESGLLGLSGISSDMEELLLQEDNSEDARRALEIYCYHARKHIGALAAALGGLDLLVFTGGIGEHAAIIRERICADLEFIGVSVDKGLNEKQDFVISSAESRVQILVVKTNEELMIARHCITLLNLKDSDAVPARG
ncbi:MAG: acetate/propionate family kinase [Candidatus Melainabacteria bacterium]|nr:acetate/propionate family kinase [Candidatus Melainabacteria bacterium]